MIGFKLYLESIIKKILKDKIMNPTNQKIQQPAQHLDWQDELILSSKKRSYFQRRTSLARFKRG